MFDVTDSDGFRYEGEREEEEEELEDGISHSVHEFRIRLIVLI